MAHKQSGFTIIETLISVTVFSVMISIAMVVVVQIAKSYQTANIKTQLMNTSRQLHSQFAQSLQYGSAASATPQFVSGPDYYVFCTGSTRFLWKISTDAIIHKNDGTADFSLIKQEKFSGDVCGELINLGDAATIPNITYLLPDNAYLTKFEIVPIGVAGSSKLVTLTTRFGVGDSDLHADDKITESCRSSIIGSEFCAVVEYSSTSLKKVINE